jgi:hypothetical protein
VVFFAIAARLHITEVTQVVALVRRRLGQLPPRS